MNESNGRPPSAPPFDTWAALDFWLRRWPWLGFWTLVLAVAGAWVARQSWGRTFTASAQLIHYAPTAADDSYRPRDIAAPSLVVMLQSQSVFEQVGARQQPPLSAKQLARALQITLDRNNDVATVTAEGADREATVELVNQFSAAAIDYTRSLQQQEAKTADASVTHQLQEVEAGLASARSLISTEAASAAAKVVEPEPTPVVANEVSPRLQAAREQLDELRVRYTDEHPLVREQRTRVVALEESARRIAEATANAPVVSRPASAPPPPVFNGRLTPEEVAMGERLRTLENHRALLMARQRAVQPFLNAPPGYFRALMPAAPSRVVEHNHRLEVGLFGILGAFFGLVGSAGLILCSEFLDNRVKTRSDVRRITGLPLLATLGDLKRLTAAECDQWAFRAWTALQCHLSLTPNHGMVCGITSANSGDGRSTWTGLLARAARACGFRVLTITARPSPAMSADLARREKRPQPSEAPATTDTNEALNANVLSTPGQIAEQLTGVENPPMVNIPLPGWVWNLERRKQWQAALEVWRAIENVVIFVELPPASVSETVLLAENIPNLLWLVDSKKSDAAETHAELETLRHARCNLVGAVLNRERAVPIRGRFSRWLGRSAFLLPLCFLPPSAIPTARAAEAPSVTAENADPLVASTGFSLGVSTRRAAWQQRLTLGPGDVLSFHIFGLPELTREEVPVGPDGRISYLEAENIAAAGLTVDELRAKVEEELGRFRRAPQAYVTPVAYRSKKYYVLGNVMQKGAFPLDRPITVIEAVARAQGFAGGAASGNIVEGTDFSRSFVSRGGKRLPVNFEKLFFQGDLTQNVVLEPDDYLYFPPGASGQVYVLGEVRAPGAASWEAGASVLSVIAGRGGFTDRAWQQRVLIVRGGLNRPQAIKVDVGAALSGDSANVALESGDLIYVSNRPWIRAEDLLDRAATAFVESAVITWTGIQVGPKNNFSR